MRSSGRSWRSRLRGAAIVWHALSIVEKVAAIVFLATVFLAVFGPILAPYSPTTADPAAQLTAPNASHWLGTDENGMDILSRILASPRTDVAIASIATGLSFAIGTVVGAATGYLESSGRAAGSVIGEGILRLLDVIQAFPVFVLAMVLVAMRGPNAENIVIGIAFVNMPVFIRLVRTEVLSLQSRLFTEAARAVGNSGPRLVVRHLLPNALPPAVVQISVTIGFSIFLTAGLSFVGAGIPAPTPELGSMISLGADYLVTGQWWVAMFPGIALALIVFGFAGTGETVGRLLTPGPRGVMAQEGQVFGIGVARPEVLESSGPDFGRVAG